MALEVVLGILMVFYFAPLPALMPAMFPVQIRTTGMSLSYNIGVTLMGGLAPLILTALVEKFLAPLTGLVLHADRGDLAGLIERGP